MAVSMERYNELEARWLEMERVLDIASRNAEHALAMSVKLAGTDEGERWAASAKANWTRLQVVRRQHAKVWGEFLAECDRY